MSDLYENDELMTDKDKKKALKKAEKEKKKQQKAEKKDKKIDNAEVEKIDKSTDDSEAKNADKSTVDAEAENKKKLNNDVENDNTDKMYESEDNKKKRKKRKKEKRNANEVNVVKDLLSLILYIGAVVLLCYFILTYVGCRSRVDGDSMNDTLQNNDNLWVDKLSYTFGDPKRFDVIIFNYDEDTTYVKRIIGLPGETIRIDQDGNIFVNEKLLKENYGKEVILSNKLGRANQPVLLGEDEYFVLGDNRNNSSDSRWPDVGNVDREDIVGKVVLRITPISKIGTID